MEKIKGILTYENFQSFLSYLTSGSLFGYLFGHFNDIVSGAAGIVGLAVGVQRFMYDRQRFRGRDAANDR